MKHKSSFIFYWSFILAIVLPMHINAQDKNNEILMTIGSEEVSLFEFKRLYLKNAEIGGVSETLSLEDYLELFTKFKSKVLEAEHLGLDTLASFREELARYRNQLAQPYLTDRNTIDKLTEEAYERMQLEINASHILIKIASDALPEDTLKAFEKAINIRDRIMINKEAFDQVARGTSDDPSAKTNSGNLGFFTVFQMVYPFETSAYNTPPGMLSMPIRSRYGYHLIRVDENREARGTIKVAHIMVAVPRSSDNQTEKEAEALIHDLYNRIQEGEAFADLADKYSDDYNSAKNGGELAWFGTGSMVPEFETAAFELIENGEVSKPVRTSFGWHIIKRIDKKEMGSFEELEDEIRRKVLSSDRAGLAQEKFIETLKQEYSYAIDSSTLDPFYFTIDGTNFNNGTWIESISIQANELIFSFGGLEFHQEDFINFLTSQSGRRFQGSSKKFVVGLLNDYESQSLTEYEKKQLPLKNRDFHFLLKEYHDGMLLFEISDQMVWSKAIEDSIGLRAFYEQQKLNYLGPPSLKVIQFELTDPGMEKEVLTAIKKAKKRLKDPFYLANKFAQDTSSVRIETKTVFKGEDPHMDNILWDKGKVSTRKTVDNTFIYLVLEVYDPAPKPLNEIRGIVTSDFQDKLENEWLNALEKKYPVQVNNELFEWLKSNLNN